VGSARIPELVAARILEQAARILEQAAQVLERAATKAPVERASQLRQNPAW
jgi:hypothetical protein